MIGLLLWDFLRHRWKDKKEECQGKLILTAWVMGRAMSD